MESIEAYLSWCKEKDRTPGQADNLREFCQSSRA